MCTPPPFYKAIMKIGKTTAFLMDRIKAERSKRQFHNWAAKCLKKMQDAVDLQLFPITNKVISTVNTKILMF
jgi:hypothetical protein